MKYDITVPNLMNQLVPEIKINGCNIDNRNDQFFPCGLCNIKQSCLREHMHKGYAQLNYAIYKKWIK